MNWANRLYFPLQILKHDEVMADVMENADRKEEDEKQFAKRLQKAVALLLVIPELISIS